MPFLMDPGSKLASGQELICLIKTQTHQFCDFFVQERLPEMPVLLSLIPAGVRSYINLRV